VNRGGLGARSLNIELQNALNPPGEIRIDRFGWTFCPGDKVMQIENEYDKDVYNGDLGVVSRIDIEEGEFVVDFEGREVTYGFGELDELVLAYATTIHKSQGSEYPAVVIPLTIQHYAMLQRNLVYTGVTRGKRLVVLVGQRKALAIAVKGAQTRRRWSAGRVVGDAISGQCVKTDPIWEIAARPPSRAYPGWQAGRHGSMIRAAGTRISGMFGDPNGRSAMAKPVPTALTGGERPAIASVCSSARHSRRPGRDVVEGQGH
jgi:hypothetical protein